MLATAQAFIDEMERANMKPKHTRDLDDGKSLVVCGVNGKNNAHYDVFFFFDKDGTSLSMRVFKLVTFPEDRTDKVYDTLNELNRKFRWVKFFCDHECNVNVQEDAPLAPADAGKYCMRMLVRAAQIIDSAYPDLMRALWA